MADGRPQTGLVRMFDDLECGLSLGLWITKVGVWSFSLDNLYMIVCPQLSGFTILNASL